LQKLKAMNNIKAQNILELETNEREEKKKRVDSYVTLAFNDEFSNFDLALFEMSSRAMKELL